MPHPIPAVTIPPFSYKCPTQFSYPQSTRTYSVKNRNNEVSVGVGVHPLCTSIAEHSQCLAMHRKLRQMGKQSEVKRQHALPFFIHTSASVLSTPIIIYTLHPSGLLCACVYRHRSAKWLIVNNGMWGISIICIRSKHWSSGEYPFRSSPDYV